MATISRNENHFDYAILGGGCFGASTALALIKEWSDVRIIWFEGTDPHTASKDINKIIRTPYPGPDYVAFAGESTKNTGWVQVVGEGSHAAMMKGPSDRMISPEEMQQRVGSQGQPKLEANEELRFNENIGYADSNLAVEAVAEKASLLGVRREKKDITRLITDGGVCRGVAAGGDIVVAKKTIVAAGSWTPQLLEKSRVGFPSNFFTVSATGVATMPLEEKEFDDLKYMPILVTERGEIMLSRQHKVLKITSTSTFRIKHPSELKDLESFDVRKNRALLEKMLPQFTGRRLSWWICPDLMTPYQHPLVDQVPGTERLYLAVGGSYHSANSLPNIGHMVVQRLRGQNSSYTLEDRLLERWGWDRSMEKIAVHSNLIPKDIQGSYVVQINFSPFRVELYHRFFYYQALQSRLFFQ